MDERTESVVIWGLSWSERIRILLGWKILVGIVFDGDKPKGAIHRLLPPWWDQRRDRTPSVEDVRDIVG